MKTPVQVRDELEAENKALRERAESAEASFNQRDLQMRAALEETESMFQRCQRAETENVELREAKEKAEAACAAMRVKLEEHAWHAPENCTKTNEWRGRCSCCTDTLSTNCGQPLLDRVKAMEEILKDCQHLRSQVFPMACFPECPACRWEALKKATA